MSGGDPKNQWALQVVTRPCLWLIRALLAVSIALSGCAVSTPSAVDEQDDESASPTRQAPSPSQWNDAPDVGDCFQVLENKRGDFFLWNQVQKVPCSTAHTLEVYSPPFHEADGKDDYVDRCADVAEYGGDDTSGTAETWAKRMVISAIIGKTERNETVPISCTWGVVGSVAPDLEYEQVTGTLRGVLDAPDAIERVGACVVVKNRVYDPATAGACQEGQGQWLLSLVTFRDSAAAFPGEASLHARATPRCRKFLSRMVPRGEAFDFLVAPPTKADWDAGKGFAACLIRYDDISARDAEEQV